MTAYREAWIECDGYGRLFGLEDGYHTYGNAVVKAVRRGWVERYRKGAADLEHLCPDCKDKA